MLDGLGNRLHFFLAQGVNECGGLLLLRTVAQIDIVHGAIFGAIFLRLRHGDGCGAIAAVESRPERRRWLPFDVILDDFRSLALRRCTVDTFVHDPLQPLRRTVDLVGPLLLLVGSVLPNGVAPRLEMSSLRALRLLRDELAGLIVHRVG